MAQNNSVSSANSFAMLYANSNTLPIALENEYMVENYFFPLTELDGASLMVYVYYNDNLVSEASVSIGRSVFEQSGLTSGSGKIRFSDLANGNYTVCAVKAGLGGAVDYININVPPYSYDISLYLTGNPPTCPLGGTK